MEIAWNNFTPYSSLIGGALIGISAAILLLCLGRVAGISGVVAGLLKPVKSDWPWQLCFVLGLISASWIYQLFAPLPSITFPANMNTITLIIAGVLVGVGTVLGSGCTSGHGVCGISRLSMRSILATLNFYVIWLYHRLCHQTLGANIMIKMFIAAISGIIFGIGLIIAGMTDPSKVIAFLDLAGAWDPSLALVMGGAIAVAFIPFSIAKNRTTCFIGTPIQLPTKITIDRRLVIGSLLFGVGWGIAGICPGPAIVLIGTGMSQGIIFGLAMIAGMAAVVYISKNYCFD